MNFRLQCFILFISILLTSCYTAIRLRQTPNYGVKFKPNEKVLVANIKDTDLLPEVGYKVKNTIIETLEACGIETINYKDELVYYPVKDFQLNDIYEKDLKKLYTKYDIDFVISFESKRGTQETFEFKVYETKNSKEIWKIWFQGYTENPVVGYVRPLNRSLKLLKEVNECK